METEGLSDLTLIADHLSDDGNHNWARSVVAARRILVDQSAQIERLQKDLQTLLKLLAKDREEIERLKAELERVRELVPRWIPADKILPEVDDYVLWYHPEHGHFVREIDKDDEPWWLDCMGWQHLRLPDECKTCGGIGSVPVTEYADGHAFLSGETCPTCNGIGLYIAAPGEVNEPQPEVTK